MLSYSIFTLFCCNYKEIYFFFKNEPVFVGAPCSCWRIVFLSVYYGCVTGLRLSQWLLLYLQQQQRRRQQWSHQAAVLPTIRRWILTPRSRRLTYKSVLPMAQGEMCERVCNHVRLIIGLFTVYLAPSTKAIIIVNLNVKV